MTTVVTSEFMRVLPTSEARGELSHTLERFRQEGAAATPMVFGSHRKPEGVVIPFELFEQLVPVLEDVVLAQLLRARLAEPGEPRPLDELVTELGFTDADFD